MFTLILVPLDSSWLSLYPQMKNTKVNTTYTVGHTIFLTLYSVGKLDEK
jgi:hypothetical protein